MRERAYYADKVPQTPGCDFCAGYRPAQSCRPDTYLYISTCDHNHLRMVVGYELAGRTEINYCPQCGVRLLKR